MAVKHNMTQSIVGSRHTSRDVYMWVSMLKDWGPANWLGSIKSQSRAFCLET